VPEPKLNVVVLRDVTESDLHIFFEQQLDSDANHMAAFTGKDPTDRAAFDARWEKIFNSAEIIMLTIEFEGQVAGVVGSYVMFDDLEVTYWLGKAYWGKSIATTALQQFLQIQQIRPIHARAAKDNSASIRVLEKCGFVLVREEKGFANAREEEIAEVVMTLKTIP